MEEDKITISSIKKSKEVRIDVRETLEPQRGCCIYRVPKALRKENKEAYTPKLISIGPLHHRKNELADMEKQKITYQREFSKRITGKTWQDLINSIEKYEQTIRNSYEETCKLIKFEFIRMILYDAVLIIELFLRDYECTKDFLLDRPHLKIDISVDLQLLENQLPFFVLQELYSLAFHKTKARAEGYPSLFFLSCGFFHGKQLSEIDVEKEVKHFTDLGRYFMTRLYQELETRGTVEDLPCAVKLHESGVNFTRNEGECLLDVRFGKINKQWLGGHVLQIPRIEVYDDTELLIRNIMAWEQCHYPHDTHVCNVIDLMDYLVDTEADVDLLAGAGVISNNVGDRTRVARMFNRLGLQISLSRSCHHAVSEALKNHYKKSWNHTTATFKSVYFTIFGEAPELLLRFCLFYSL